MKNTATFDASNTKPTDYKTAVAVGLKEIEVRLETIERNQVETEKLKIETREVAQRVEKLLETF